MSNYFPLIRPVSIACISFGCFFSSLAPKIHAGEIEVTSFGHSSVFIKSKKHSVLLNPFKAVACAEGLKEPRLRADVILASSELADEGAKIARVTYLVKPGSYRVGSLKLEGFSADHDRLGGRRFGQTTIWQWEQEGKSFVHLGGAVVPLTQENKVLIGRPDVLIIAVGGGAKVYNGIEAAKVVLDLQPKRVIPVHYVRSQSSKLSNCDLTGVEPFLAAMKDTEVKKVDKTFILKDKLGEKMIINLIQ